MKINNRYGGLLGCLILLWAGDIQAQTPSISTHLTLKQALELAKENNLSLKISELQVDIKKDNEKILFNEKLPDFEFTSGYNRLANIKQFENKGLLNKPTTYDVPNQQYHFTLELAMPVYTGGRIKAEEKIAEIETDIAHLRHKKEERDIKLEVVTAFLQVQFLLDQRHLIESKMREDSIVIKQVESLKNNGKVTKNEVLRTTLQLSNHRMTLSEISNNILIAEHQLATILNFPSNQSLHIVEEDLKSDGKNSNLPLDAYLNLAFEEHEDVKLAQQEILITHQDKKIVKSNYLPQINLKGDYGLSYPNFMFFPPQSFLYGFGLIGFDFKYSISNLYKNKAKMHRVNRQMQVKHIEAEEVREKLNHRVFAAYRKVLEADERIEIAKEAIEQAAENYRLVKMKYINKLSLISELIDADNTFLEAQSSFITAQINRQLKYYQLQFAVGKL